MLVSLLVACGAQAGPGSGSTPRPTPRANSGCTQGETCPTFAFYKSDFCELQAVRDMIAEKRLPVSALPAWADRTEQDGVAIIIDFGKPQSVNPDRRLDQLDAAVLTPRKIRLDRTTVTYCVDHATPEDFHHNRRVSPNA